MADEDIKSKDREESLIEIILGSSHEFSLPSQIFNAITFSGILTSLLIFCADTFLGQARRENNFAFGLSVTVAYFWLYGKSRETGDYRDYTIYYVLLELAILLQSWFMYGGVAGVAPLIALHFIVTVSLILEGWRKYSLMAFIILVVTGLFCTELALPDIARHYADPRNHLINIFIYFILIGCGIVVCVMLVMQNHKMQYERINQFNQSLDQSKQDLEMVILEQKEDRRTIQKTLEEKELLLREIHHRVKNNLQVISSMLLLQQNKLQNQETLEAFNTAGSRVQSIALVHELLYQSDTIAHIDFQTYAEKLVQYLSDMYRRDQRVKIEIKADNVVLSVEDAIACGLVVTELVSNSLKYAFPGRSSGTVGIHLRDVDGQRYELWIYDNGVGFKGEVDWDKSATLGLLLVRELVEGQLEGNIQLERKAGAFWKITWSTPECESQREQDDE